MKRDTDYLRELLMDLESSDQWVFVDPMHLNSPPEEIKRSYHLRLAADAGLLVAQGKGTFRITNAGHDYLDSIRNDGIWEKTKEAINESGGSATLEVIKLIAIGFFRKQLKDRTGIEI